MILVRNGHLSKPVQTHTSSAKPAAKPRGSDAVNKEEVIGRLLAYQGMKLSAEAAPGPAKVENETKALATNVQPFAMPKARFRPREELSLWRKMFGPPARPHSYVLEDFLKQYARREWTLSERKEGFRERPNEKFITTIGLGEIRRSETWPTSQSVISGTGYIGASGTLYLCITRTERFFNAGLGSLWRGSSKGTDRSDTWYIIKRPQELFDRAAKIAGFPA